MTLLKVKLQMDEVIAERDSPRGFNPFRGLVQRRNRRWLRNVRLGIWASRHPPTRFHTFPDLRLALQTMLKILWLGICPLVDT